METIIAEVTREGINSVKWAIRRKGASNRFAKWVCNCISIGEIMEVELPRKQGLLRIEWVYPSDGMPYGC